MSTLNNIISSYITSALFHIGVSKITPTALGLQKQTTKEQITAQTEFDAEFEAITLGVSAITLLLDNLINKKIAPNSVLAQNFLSAVESLGASIIIAKNLGSGVLSNLLSNESKVDAYILGTILARNFVLKQVWDNGIDVDDPTDLQPIIGDYTKVQEILPGLLK